MGKKPKDLIEEATRIDSQATMLPLVQPREASLVYDTLMGKTPAEIALQWGVAPKTVSNEKTRVIQKLRGLFDAAGD